MSLSQCHCHSLVMYCLPLCANVVHTHSYEIHLNEEVRRKGLGKFLMQILELIGHRYIYCSGSKDKYFASLVWGANRRHWDSWVLCSQPWIFLSEKISLRKWRYTNKALSRFYNKGGLGIGLHAVLYWLIVSGQHPPSPPTLPRIALKALHV